MQIGKIVNSGNPEELIIIEDLGKDYFNVK